MKQIVQIIKILKKEKTKTMLGNFQKKKYTPFRILIGTILSARARDEVTEFIAEELFKKYKNAKQLSKAKQKDVEKIIKPIGFYRNKAKNVIAAAKAVDGLGKVPDEEKGLLALPGVGRKVAGCVLVYAFKKDAIPVDTHVHRISNRLGLVKTKTPEKTELALVEKVPRRYWQDVNDLLVHHGKTICKPITPLCGKCKIEKYCKKVGVK